MTNPNEPAHPLDGELLAKVKAGHLSDFTVANSKGLTKLEYFAAHANLNDVNTSIEEAEELIGIKLPDSLVDRTKFWALARAKLSVIYAAALVTELNK